MMELGVPAYLINATLLGVLAQRLLRRVCRTCAVTRPPHADELPPGFHPGADGLVAEAVGCRDCRNSGYPGRIGCYELLEVAEPVRAEIMRRDGGQRPVERSDRSSGSARDDDGRGAHGRLLGFYD